MALLMASEEGVHRVNQISVRLNLSLPTETALPRRDYLAIHGGCSFYNPDDGVQPGLLKILLIGHHKELPSGLCE